MKAKKSTILQLEVFEVTKCELKENLEGSSNDISLDFDFNLIQGQIKNEVLSGFHVFLKINPGKKNVKLSGKLQANGLFKINSDELSEEGQRNRFLLNNGLSIIYGIFRGIIYEKASNLEPWNRLLPTINLIEIIKEKFNPKLKEELS